MPPEDFYGVTLSRNELVCESRSETRRLDASTGHVLAVTPRKRVLLNASLIPDGKTVWTQDGNNFYFWDLRSQTRLWTWSKADIRVTSTSPGIQFSLDGRLVLALEGRKIVTHNTRTGAEEWRVYGPQYSVFALSPNGDLIYEAREDGQIWVWRV